MRSFILVAAVLALAFPAGATIYDVCASGCTYTTLSTALAAIDSDTTTVDTITVSGTITVTATNIWKVGVHLIGLNNATINASGETRCISMVSIGYGLVFKDLTFNNFIGKSNTPGMGNYGGCIRARSLVDKTSSIEFINCVFNNCDAGGNGIDADTGRGGAVYSGGTAGAVKLVFTDCTFTDCNVTYETQAGCGGGALYADGLGPITATGCTFGTSTHGNTVIGTPSYDAMGGSVRASYANVTLTNCTFTDNSANFGGAIASTHNDPGGYTLTVTGCDFTNCSSAQRGGAILYDCPTAYPGTWSIAGCTFTGNSATVYGGAIASGHTVADMDDCEFYTNTSADAGAFGVGCGLAAGIAPSLATTIDGCIFQDNGATVAGGGIYVGGGAANTSLAIGTSLFADNDAAAGSGGAIYWENPDATYALDLDIVRTIVSHATGYGIATDAADNTRLSYAFSCCDTLDLAPEMLENTPGAGAVCANCIADDPVWCVWSDDDTANDDFRLQGTSPCFASGAPCFYIGPYSWCGGDCSDCWAPGGESERRRPHLWPLR